MSDVTPITANKTVAIEEDKFKVDYGFDSEGNFASVSHPSWPFSIVRNQETGNETAFVCSDTGEPFGVLDSDAFNTVLMCWLLIDDPKLIDAAAAGSRQDEIVGGDL